MRINGTQLISLMTDGWLIILLYRKLGDVWAQLFCSRNKFSEIIIVLLIVKSNYNSCIVVAVDFVVNGIVLVC